MKRIQDNHNIKKRIGWVDAAKGVAILLVIIGHTLDIDNNIENIWRGVIFSFHMPLFFILSAFTFQFSENTEQFNRKTVKAFKHLIIPMLFLFVVQTVLDLLKGIGTSGLQFWENKAMELLYASGVDLDIDGKRISGIGMLWFLVVLFSSRTIYDWMQLKIKKTYNLYIWLFVITCFGVICGQYLKLPFSFDIALALLPFFWCAQIWKNKQIIVNRTNVWLFLGIWISTLALTYVVSGEYLELASRTYPLLPWSYITAVAGALFVGSVCRLITEKREKLCRPLIYLGKNSFLLFGIHYLDKNYEMAWRVCENNFYNSMVRVCIDLVLTITVLQICKYLLTFKNQ